MTPARSDGTLVRLLLLVALLGLLVLGWLVQQQPIGCQGVGGAAEAAAIERELR